MYRWIGWQRTLTARMHKALATEILIFVFARLPQLAIRALFDVPLGLVYFKFNICSAPDSNAKL